MDFIKNLSGGDNNNAASSSADQPKKESGFMDKLNGMAGGGRESEKQEDGIDKGTCICFHISMLASWHKDTNVIPQPSTCSKKRSSAKALRITRAPPSRPKTRRSPTSSAVSTRAPPERMSPSRTRTGSSACKQSMAPSYVH